MQVSIIVEHKSYKDEFVAFQLLRYLTDAYIRQVPEIKAGNKIKPIIPILYYHGKTRWDYQHFDYFTKDVLPSFLPYLPFYKLVKIDLQSFDDDYLLGGNNSYLNGMLMLQKYIFDQKNFLRKVKETLTIFEENIDGNYLEP